MTWVSSRVNGQTRSNWTVMSRTRRSFVWKLIVHGDNGPPKWTVKYTVRYFGQNGRSGKLGKKRSFLHNLHFFISDLIMAVVYFSRRMRYMNLERITWEFGRPVYQRLDKLNIKRLLLFIFLYLHIHMEPTKSLELTTRWRHESNFTSTQGRHHNNRL